MDFFIYTLSEPHENKVRYVGWTCNPAKRMGQHLSDVANTHKVHWIQSCLANGDKPRMQIIEVMENGTEAQVIEREVFWIATFREQGCKLTNGTNGGQGALGYTHTEETRKKMSLASLFKDQSVEARQRLTRKDVKLNPQKVKEIREKFATGQYTRYQLATEYNIAQSNLCSLLKGTIWKAAGGPLISNEGYVTQRELHADIRQRARDSL